MNKQSLFENIKRKKSFLCVGLDTDIKKIPDHLLDDPDPIFAFNKQLSMQRLTIASLINPIWPSTKVWV